MKLLYSPTSPYSAKVRMAAHHLDIGVEAVRVDTNAEPDILIGNNPLGKIPVLLMANDEAVFDSRVIMQVLDGLSGTRLFPVDAGEHRSALVLEALCDGITDCLLAIVYERRFRPVDILHQPWIDRQWSKVARGLNHLEGSLPDLNGGLQGGHFALAALAGYLDLRFAAEWQDGWPGIKAWIQEFARQFPDYPAMKPQG